MTPQTIRHYYEASPYWGSWPPATPDVITVREGRLSGGEVMQLQVRLQQNVNTVVVEEVRIQAYGSGYTLAVLAYVAEQLKQSAAETWALLSTQTLTEALDLPATKIHSAVLAERLLIQLKAALNSFKRAASAEAE